MGGPVDGPDRLAARFPACPARPGLTVMHRSSGFLGALVALEDGQVEVGGGDGLRFAGHGPGLDALEVAGVVGRRHL